MLCTIIWLEKFNVCKRFSDAKRPSDAHIDSNLGMGSGYHVFFHSTSPMALLTQGIHPEIPI